jgi:hypothetical protein
VNVTYTYGEVLDIANKAADLVIKELGLPDCGRRDVVNLVVNAAEEMDSHFLAVFTAAGPVGRDGEKREPITVA